MNDIQKIYSYVRDFGIRKDQVISCLEHVSKKKNINIEKTASYVLEYIRHIVFLCINQAAKKNMTLKDYQKKAVEHMLQNRGMIAAFDVGTGKTLTAVTVSSCILNLAKFLGKKIKVIVITPTSLQKNFKKEMEAYGLNPEDTRYHFYTTSKFGLDYKKGEIDCNKSLFIVDEAHVFRTDYRSIFSGIGMAKEGARAELAIKCASKAWKVLLLTATPIYNLSHDIVNLISMVKGEYPPSDEDPYDLIRLPNVFKKMYGNTILFQESNKSDYPLRKDILVKVIMTPKYFEEYTELENKIRQKEEGKGRKKTAPEGEKTTNAFMVKLRTASNALETCIKCDIVMNIIETGQKTIFFSEFKSSGVNIIIDKLEKKGIGYYIITGETSMNKRNEVVRDFNSPKGKNVLIITKAGGEGLDLKGVRNVILFEKGWNVSGEEQVIGRAVRYRSHKHLPLNEQDVTVWHIVTVKPTGNNFENEENFQKEKYYKTIVVNEKYIRTPPLKKEEKGKKKKSSAKEISDIYGADVYMLLQAMTKQRANERLKNALKNVEIGKETTSQGTAINHILSHLNWSALSASKYITSNIIEKFSDLFNWEILSSNKIFPFGLLEKYENKIVWDKLSRNEALPLNLVLKYKNKWDEESWKNILVFNKNLNEGLLLSHFSKLVSNWEWWSKFMEFGKINLIPKEIMIDFVSDRADKHDLLNISKNPNIPEYIIEKFPDKMNWKYLSRNQTKALNYRILNKFKNKVDWKVFSLYRDDIFLELVNLLVNNIDWITLSGNTSLKPEIISKYAGKLNWTVLAYNPNLTLDIIEENINRIDWLSLPKDPTINNFFPRIQNKNTRIIFDELETFGKYNDYVESVKNEMPLSLSYYPMLTKNFVEKHFDKVNFDVLSYVCSFVTPEIMNRYDLSMNLLRYNIFLTPEFVKQYKKEIPSSTISTNEKLNPSLIEELIKDNKINWKIFEHNKTLTPELAIKHYEKITWDSVQGNAELDAKVLDII